jgi:hypothetical protein
LRLDGWSERRRGEGMPLRAFASLCPAPNFRGGRRFVA